MVCDRCIAAVVLILNQLNLPYHSVELGEIVLENTLTDVQLKELDLQLENQGFTRLIEVNQMTVNHIKQSIRSKIAALDISDDFILSNYLVSQEHKEYSLLSKLFSSMEKQTIEQFYILQKIEKVKELLTYNEYSITEIATMLGYRSVQHLSNQFKQITAQTPSNFRKSSKNSRIPIDKI